MRSYIVKKVSGAPDWSTVPVMPIDTLLWTPEVDISAQAQICWDEENLYVRQEARESAIRMEESGPLAMACRDSCLEFFLQPTERPYYMNFEMTPKCALYLGYGPNGPQLTRLLVADPEQLFQPRAELTADGWVLTYQIPFAFIRRFFPDFAAKEGTKMRANAYKCGDKTEIQHFLAWNPIDCERPNFHCPEYFGSLTLGGE